MIQCAVMQPLHTRSAPHVWWYGIVLNCLVLCFAAVEIMHSVRWLAVGVVVVDRSGDFKKI